MLNYIEWIVVGLLGVAILIWGPAKISDIAKALGAMRKEFNEAAQTARDLATKDQFQPPLHIPATAKNPDERLIETAREFGISTEGKTRQELTAEIESKNGNDAERIESF
jgi:Sec-independent protein translocase protein TatA